MLKYPNAYEVVSAEAHKEARSVAESILNAVREGEARDEDELHDLIHQEVDNALTYTHDQWLFAWGLPDSDDFDNAEHPNSGFGTALAQKAYCNLREFITRGWADEFEAAMKERGES